MAGFKALQNTLDGNCLLAENNKDQLRRHPPQRMDSSAKGNSFTFHFCPKLAVTKKILGRPTLPINFLEQLTMLVVPPFAHIHTVWPVQFREKRRALL